jgi:hypothetical protein
VFGVLYNLCYFTFHSEIFNIYTYDKIEYNCKPLSTTFLRVLTKRYDCLFEKQSN